MRHTYLGINAVGTRYQPRYVCAEISTLFLRDTNPGLCCIILGISAAGTRCQPRYVHTEMLTPLLSDTTSVLFYNIICISALGTLCISLGKFVPRY